MEQMVAANREPVAVARYYPDREFGSGYFESRRNCGRAAMYGMETIGIHVVRKAAGAADSGDEDIVFTRNSEFRHHLLNLRQDRIVATARTPADFLVGYKILTCQLHYRPT